MHSLDFSTSHRIFTRIQQVNKWYNRPVAWCATTTPINKTGISTYFLPTKKKMETRFPHVSSHHGLVVVVPYWHPIAFHELRPLATQPVPSSRVLEDAVKCWNQPTNQLLTFVYTYMHRSRVYNANIYIYNIYIENLYKHPYKKKLFKPHLESLYNDKHRLISSHQQKIIKNAIFPSNP